eukprot:Nk52_evm5s247 gene=Nk52_evmTU5s247
MLSTSRTFASVFRNLISGRNHLVESASNYCYRYCSYSTISMATATTLNASEDTAATDSSSVRCANQKETSKPKKGWWIPTSDGHLKHAEEKVCSNLESSHAHYEVPIETGEEEVKINTLEFSHEDSVAHETEHPVVLLHGFGAGWGFYFKNIDSIAKNSSKLYAIDAPGMGSSSRNFNVKKLTPEQTEEKFVDALEQWREKVGIEKFTFVGHSFGGYLSGLYALKYPDRVSKLVLLSPVGVPAKSEEAKKKFENFRKTLPWYARALVGTVEWGWTNNISPQSLVRGAGPYGKRLVSGYVYRRFVGLTDEEYKVMAEYAYHVSAARGSGEFGLLNVLEFGAWAKNPLKNRLNDLKVDTAFMYGSQDWMDAKAGAELSANMRHANSEYHIIDGAGHQLFIDRPEEFNSIMARILRDGKASSRNNSNNNSASNSQK